MPVRYEPVVDKETGKQTGTFVFQVYTDVNGKTYESYFGCITDLSNEPPDSELGHAAAAVNYFSGPATADSHPNAVKGLNFWLLPRHHYADPFNAADISWCHQCAVVSAMHDRAHTFGG